MFIWLSVIAVLIVYLLVIFYIGRMTMKWLLPKQSKRFKGMYMIVFFLLANMFLIGSAADQEWLRAIGSYAMALLYILVFSVPCIHLLVYMLRFTKISRLKVEKWAGWLILSILFISMVYGTFNAYSPVVHTYDISIKKESKNVTQLKIVMASDMHFGTLSNKQHAARMVEEINALKPDLVLFPGDIVDDRIDEFVNQGMSTILAKIQSTYGVYASLGNHDKGDLPQLIETLEQSNITILYDESIVIDDSFTLIGRKDKTEKDRASLAELMQNVDATKPVIVLEHQPYDLDVAQSQGVDLMVSGHTHRGQLAPFQYITGYIYENDWGYLQKEQMHSIVSSGFGFWGPPIRTGSRSEIVQINVNFGEQD